MGKAAPVKTCWKLFLGLVKTVIWTQYHSCSTTVLHQICSCLMNWVLKMPVSYVWPFWCENIFFKITESPAHVNKSSFLLFFFLGGGLHNTTFSEQMDCGLISCDWVTSSLPASRIEGRCWYASQGFFCALSHRISSRKLL